MWFGSSCCQTNLPTTALSLPVKAAEDRQAAGGGLVLPTLPHPGFALKLMCADKLISSWYCLAGLVWDNEVASLALFNGTAVCPSRVVGGELWGMSWHVEEPAALEKYCSAGLVALPASHLGSRELEDQSILGGCWLGLLVKQAGALGDGRWVMGCCDRLSKALEGGVGCRSGGTHKPAVQVLACQAALLQAMGRG